MATTTLPARPSRPSTRRSGSRVLCRTRASTGRPTCAYCAVARSAVQDAGLLLLEFGLGQHARRQQLAELLQLGEPLTHVGCRRLDGWTLPRRNGLGIGLLRL